MFEKNYNKLKRRSTDILAIFTTTVSDLVIVNKDIDAESELIGMKADVFAASEKEERQKITELKMQQISNYKIIDKITQFLEV